ncbi:MAG: NAD(FAD)-utilizing dehydrogenase, partial [Firmicutes bacterium]|nr:NAD(FAD)-utilizing dehydrogenase [Bacillota bacterium]
SSINEAMPFMGRRLRGFNSPDAMLFAVETRSSSPVRFFRDEHFMSNIKGLFPAGEGAGYAGGIMSAAVDGIKVAEAISLQGPRS